MIRDDDPSQEGHTREWADRARVEMNPEEDIKKPASPKQSPDSSEEAEGKNGEVKKNKNDETVY